MARKRAPTNTLALRLDGENLHPKTADPRVTLRIASAYFEALATVAAASGVDLQLQGCRILDKCLSVETRFRPEAREGLAASASLVTQYLLGTAKPPRGTKRLIDELDHAMGELTTREACEVYIDEAKAYSLAVPVAKDTQTSTSLTTMRCHVVRAGGDAPKVRLRARGEARAFVAECQSKSQAAELGKILYREVDAELKVVRDLATGLIIEGEIRSFIEVPVTDDPLAAWKAWFAPYKAAWSDVEDIDAEIARLRSDGGAE